jgi:hypothetical protein
MERNPRAVEFWAGAERRLNGLSRPAGANAKSLSHYTAISAGWLRHFGRRAPEPVDAGHAKWVHDEFESRIPRSSVRAEQTARNSRLGFISRKLC